MSAKGNVNNIKKNPKAEKDAGRKAGRKLLPGLYPYIICLLMLVASLIMSGVIAPDYVRKLEDLSFWMGGSWFFNHCMTEPGGLLTWLATFMTQFFYHPWLGGALYGVAMCGLWLLTMWAFGIRKENGAIASVTPLLMLLFMHLPGYLIFIAKTPGFAWTGMFGFAVSVTYFGIWRCLGRQWIRAAAIVLMAVTYPFFGFYALFGAALCVIAELIGRRGWWNAAAGAVAIAVIPQGFFYFFESHAMYSRLYLYGIPRMSVKFLAVMTPCWISIGVLTLLAVASCYKKFFEKRASLTAAVTVAAGLAALVSVFVFRYHDVNFTTAIRMERALREGDYKTALGIVSAQEEPHTRAVDLYTHAALCRDGTAGDSLFVYRMADAPYVSPYPEMGFRMVGARSLTYLFGRINDSYRWCMEDMVEYGYKVEYLEYMIRCALMNEEPALARRYIRMLGSTLFHKKEAEKLRKYADNPESMASDPAFSVLKPLMAYNNQMGGDGGLVELYILRATAGLRGGPPELVDLSLQFNLIQKDIDKFWPRFMHYANTHDRIPKHYQEAAVLFSELEHKVDWHQLPIDPQVAERFSKFMEMAQKYGKYSEDQTAEIFDPIFGDTYWYYYFFVNNLKTQ